MPAAKCENCGAIVNWHNRRGVKLKEQRHTGRANPLDKYVCGGRLIYVVQDPITGEYVTPAELKRRRAARREASCRKSV